MRSGLRGIEKAGRERERDRRRKRGKVVWS